MSKFNTPKVLAMGIIVVSMSDIYFGQGHKGAGSRVFHVVTAGATDGERGDAPTASARRLLKPGMSPQKVSLNLPHLWPPLRKPQHQG